MLREYDRLYTEAVELPASDQYSLASGGFVLGTALVPQGRQYRNEQYGRIGIGAGGSQDGLTVTRNTKKRMRV
jgi:hypothetical protein